MGGLGVSGIGLRSCDRSIPLTAGALPSETKSGAATSCDCNSRGTTAASLASTLSAAFWSFGSRRGRRDRVACQVLTPAGEADQDRRGPPFRRAGLQSPRAPPHTTRRAVALPGGLHG